MIIFVPDDPDDTSDDVLAGDGQSFPFEHEQFANDRTDSSEPLSGAELRMDSWLASQPRINITSTPSTNDYPYPSAMIPRFITQAAMNASWSEYVVATDVTAFDVRVYDPTALGYVFNNVALTPSDVGYAGPYQMLGSGAFQYNEPTWTNLLTTVNSGNAAALFRGAYVDLDWYRALATPANLNTLTSAVNANGLYGSVNTAFSQYSSLSGTDSRLTFYDTWSLGYEKDGIDQDEAVDTQIEVDEAFDGIDNLDNGMGVGGVDDASELETSPPFAAPITGIEIRIRQIEVSTGQVRQVSVLGDFTN